MIKAYLELIKDCKAKIEFYQTHVDYASDEIDDVIEILEKEIKLITKIKNL